MLDTTLKAQLKTYLQNLKTPVELVVSLDDSKPSREMQSLANDIAGLSKLITVSESAQSNERKPSMMIRSDVTGSEIRFAGLPMGHEFTSLVLALLHSGGHTIKVSEELAEHVRALPGQYRFETYVSLSCQNCPDVVQALNMMAALNPNITHNMIDGALFQDEVNERNIMAVPSVYLNGELFAQGRISLQEVLNKLDTGAAQRQAEVLSEKESFDVH